MNVVEFPPLSLHEEWNIVGNTWRHACVDLVFAGLGWIALTGKGNLIVDVNTFLLSRRRHYDYSHSSMLQWSLSKTTG